MPVERPTFSESWYRIAALRPRLRGSVQIHRQHFRGQMWHVVQDPSNNQFFRLSEAAYHFVALLDGKRTVADAWKISNEQLGDSAPTQGEAIQLLGQLYSSNLLQAELPPDSQGLLNRQRKRVSREVRSYLTNLLFIRIPLLDPDRFLDSWVSIFGKLFTWFGAILWMVLVSIGVYFAIGKWDDLRNQTESFFNQQNLLSQLPLMYLTFAVVKALHEFGHAFACKKFGKQGGSGGEVHVMGIMFLVFSPVPYVDASSSSAYRSKWHKIIVGAAGMIVEMALAAIAAIVWAHTPSDSVAHSLAWNVMFIGSVTTVLFNANPLLRYDGYYILSDLLEIANLQQRSKDYIYYLVKRYVWGVKQARNPAHTRGEKGWFIFYGIASTIYRTVIVVGILLFIAKQLFVVGVLLAVASAIAWLVVPIWKFIHYLLTNNELMRVRPRAIISTVAVIATIVGLVGLVPMSDTVRIEGVVEPSEMRVVYTRTEGFVQSIRPTNTQVQADKTVLMEASNPEMEAQLGYLRAERRGWVARKNKAQSVRELANVRAIEQVLDGLDKQIARLKDDLSYLHLKAPMSGLWYSPQGEKIAGAYLRRDQQLGIISGTRMIIRAVAGQTQGPMILSAVGSPTQGEKLSGQSADASLPGNGLDWSKIKLEVRVQGRPDLKFDGKVETVSPAGKKNLPSASLGYAVGGSMAIDPQAKEGTEAAEEFFEFRIEPLPPKSANAATQPADQKANVAASTQPTDQEAPPPLLAGQRVIVRFELPKKPLALQWWRKILQMLPKYHL